MAIATAASAAAIPMANKASTFEELLEKNLGGGKTNDDQPTSANRNSLSAKRSFLKRKTETMAINNPTTPSKKRRYYADNFNKDAPNSSYRPKTPTTEKTLTKKEHSDIILVTKENK